MKLRTAETSVDKSLYQLPSVGIANHKAAKADDVHIVVLHPLMGGKVDLSATVIRSFMANPP